MKAKWFLGLLCALGLGLSACSAAPLPTTAATPTVVATPTGAVTSTAMAMPTIAAMPTTARPRSTATLPARVKSMTPDLQVGRVDIGVAQLHVRCYGKGSPTVVFNAGPGDTWVTWEQVMSEVAKFTRVCAYDRAGVGSSSPGPKPRTSQQMADEFALLLEKGNIPGPYVLVSHSTSNWIDRLYTAQHRDQVAALVFVSPFHEDFISGILAILDPYPDDLAIARNEIAAQGEGQSVDDWLTSADQVRAVGPLGNQPLILLIHSKSPGSEPYAKQMDAMLAQQEQLLLALSTRSARLQSDQSSFRIQTADPQAVVEAVRQAILLTLSRATPTRMPNSK